jgi:hypothetical protein
MKSTFDMMTVPLKSDSVYFFPALTIKNKKKQITVSFNGHSILHIDRYFSNIFWWPNYVGIKLLSCIGEKLG